MEITLNDVQQYITTKQRAHELTDMVESMAWAVAAGNVDDCEWLEHYVQTLSASARYKACHEYIEKSTETSFSEQVRLMLQQWEDDARTKSYEAALTEALEIEINEYAWPLAIAQCSGEMRSRLAREDRMRFNAFVEENASALREADRLAELAYYVDRGCIRGKFVVCSGEITVTLPDGSRLNLRTPEGLAAARMITAEHPILVEQRERAKAAAMGRLLTVDEVRTAIRGRQILGIWSHEKFREYMGRGYEVVRLPAGHWTNAGDVQFLAPEAVHAI